jgi:hypothetical protein
VIPKWGEKRALKKDVDGCVVLYFTRGQKHIFAAVFTNSVFIQIIIAISTCLFAMGACAMHVRYVVAPFAIIKC